MNQKLNSDIVEHLCQKLRCSVLATDLQKLQHAREKLTTLQQIELFEHIRQLDNDPRLRQESIYIWRNDTPAANENVKEDVWHGFFKGFEIISEMHGLGLNRNKQCIELTRYVSNEDLDGYLRAGVRCFVIDLFAGTAKENQMIIVRLRENELAISKEYGFLLSVAVFAKLSPRLQYTGLMKPPATEIYLTKGDEFLLTTDRYWSTRANKDRAYVNARFLLSDVKVCDFILIGPDIQLQVKEMYKDRLRCHVDVGGVLKSQLPVLFPGRCNKFAISMEELEDITFAKEVDINTIVSSVEGTKGYFNNLQECMKQLNCERMRLFAQMFINGNYCDEDDLLWVAEEYDGFIFAINTMDATQHEQNILVISRPVEKLIEHAYDLCKPIIFDPAPIADKRLFVDPSNNKHVFFYPDKYLFCCHGTHDFVYLQLLQNAIFKPMPRMELSLSPYTDTSTTGSATLARSCVAAAYEYEVGAIFVCSIVGRMAIKIAHFRPNVPIIFITGIASAVDYMPLYHNITMLYLRDCPKLSHQNAVYKQLLFGLLFAKSRKIIRNGEKVILVYGEEPGTKLPDKYVFFNFDKKTFTERLSKILQTSGKEHPCETHIDDERISLK